MSTPPLAFLGQTLPNTRPNFLTQRSNAQSRTRPSVYMVSTRRPPTKRRTTSLFSTDNDGKNLPSPRVRVEIEAPAPNRRDISANNLINAPMHMVWDLLSDYSHLADYIPNLMVSDVKPHPRGGIRVEQCGAQKILGFQFRASLVMDMTEVNPQSAEWRAINFDLVSSRDFRQFQGVWRMERVDENRTALYYCVSIVPKGLVPVRAIEWRISEDVPENMNAVRLECERKRRLSVAADRREQVAEPKNIELQ